VTTERWTAVLLLLGVVALGWAGMAWGWRRRAGAQRAIPKPASPPAATGEPLAVAEGLYVGSVMAGRWLDRVVPHGLGARSNADLAVYPTGLLLERDGADAVWVPREDLLAVRRDTGLAGKVTETGGLVVWTWQLGPVSLDSGLRPRYAADSSALVQAVETLHQEAP
jgi:hypothetical protein